MLQNLKISQRLKILVLVQALIIVGIAGVSVTGLNVALESMQTLNRNAVEGINLPDTVVRKGIHSYQLHTTQGSVEIATPALEKTIATVSRGGGPKGLAGFDKESFDDFLLSRAVEQGAVLEPMKIDKVRFRDARPVLFSNGREILQADLVVGAFGVNSSTAGIFEELDFGYREPATVKAAIAEMSFEEEIIQEHFGNAIHLFLLPVRNLKFAALIPKGPYLTVCILGRDITGSTVQDFLDMPLVKKVLPPGVSYKLNCKCLPRMNVRAPKIPYSNRVVMIGDAGSTRLFKDGLGAAYTMGKAAANTALLHGVRSTHFKEHYMPVYKGLVTDNFFGYALYMVIGIYRSFTLLTRAMLNVVRMEQKSDREEKILSSILWDMFTGNERYKNVFFKSAKVRMHLDMWVGLFKGMGIFGGKNG